MSVAQRSADRSNLITRSEFFIDGEWVSPAADEVIEVIEAATEEVMGSVPAGTAEDVDRAVAAASKAFATWGESTRAERVEVMENLVAGLTAREEEIARIISREVGMPFRQSLGSQAESSTTQFHDTLNLLRTFAFEENIGTALVRREPIGVVAAITPWNYPLSQIAFKVAPALAAGCTVVIKPSEVAPLSAFVLAEVAQAAGMPAGVLNLVTGYGPVVGEALAAHPNVDMVSFTGSTRAGRRVSELASGTVKRVALELGGKSPNVILEDADLEAAVRDGIADAFHNSGQTCSALTRMLVPRSRLAEAEEIAVRYARAYALVDPQGDDENGLGPVISEVQRERVRGYIERGESEGARMLMGGAEPPADFQTGYYVQPTLFSDVTRDMTIAKEEIFGPVLAIMPYDDEDEAVEIANDSIYGLAAGVWAGTRGRGEDVARRIRAGMVRINGSGYGTGVPFGGYRQSGNGRENGRYGLEEFLEIKALLR
jgi:aldehyde dehydrogenase (NAD+)